MIRITGACSRRRFSVDLCGTATSLSRARKVHASPPHFAQEWRRQCLSHTLTPGATRVRLVCEARTQTAGWTVLLDAALVSQLRATGGP